jgi:hypothetical protein
MIPIIFNHLHRGIFAFGTTIPRNPTHHFKVNLYEIFKKENFKLVVSLKWILVELLTSIRPVSLDTCQVSLWAVYSACPDLHLIFSGVQIIHNIIGLSWSKLRLITLNNECLTFSRSSCWVSSKWYRNKWVWNYRRKSVFYISTLCLRESSL